MLFFIMEFISLLKAFIFELISFTISSISLFELDNKSLDKKLINLFTDFFASGIKSSFTSFKFIFAAFSFILYISFFNK